MNANIASVCQMLLPHNKLVPLLPSDLKKSINATLEANSNPLYANKHVE